VLERRDMYGRRGARGADRGHLYDNGSRQIGPLRFLSPAAMARASGVNVRPRHDPVAARDAAVAA
jgi:hypothetical protein